MDNPSNPYSGGAGAAPAFEDPFKEPAAPAGEPAGGAPAEGAEPAAAAEPEPEWLGEAPEEYKTISSHANLKAEHKKWLRDTYGELHTFKSSPYGTPEALTELTELFPGGIEDLRTAAQALQEQSRVQRMLESGDPDQMNEALEERLIANADSFIAQLHGGLDALKRSNLMTEYQDIASVLTKDVLEQVTDGGYASFHDGLAQLAEKYRALAQTNPDEAQKVAGQLAASAMELGGWWGRAKNKLGFGEKLAGERPSVRGPVTTRQNPSDQREIQAATRDVQSFNGRLSDSHNQAINPLVAAAIKKEIALQKVAIPDGRMKRILKDVNQDILANLARDPQFQALLNREHYKGNREDMRGYDTSDRVMRTVVDAAKRRAEKLIPKLVQGYVSELGVPTTSAPPDPAANVRGGGTPSGNQNKRSAQDILKDKKVGVAESLDALFAN